MSYACQLSDRAVIRLGGVDVFSFLQGIITQDVAVLDKAPCLFTLLLSAQGKFQHDFFLMHRPHEDTVLLDVAAAHKEALLKKLKMYRLRAKVDIVDEAAKWHVITVWGKGLAEVVWPARAIKATDPRLAGLGMRCLLPVGENFISPGMEIVSENAYHAHRLALGVPDGVRDAGEREVALELNASELSAMSFTKGCYVGQEVTARMHYRTVLRKCLHQVSVAQGALPASGTPVLLHGKEIGQVRSSQGAVGLAMLRISQVQAAQKADEPMMADGMPLQVRLPEYMQAKIDSLTEDSAAATDEE